MVASDNRRHDVSLLPSQLEGQIVFGEGLAQSLTFAAQNLRQVALYWKLAAATAFALAMGIGGLLVVPSKGFGFRLIYSDPGQILLATTFTGLLCIAFYCFARSFGLRQLAGEADMLSQSNMDAVRWGQSALEENR